MTTLSTSDKVVNTHDGEKCINCYAHGFPCMNCESFSNSVYNTSIMTWEEFKVHAPCVSNMFGFPEPQTYEEYVDTMNFINEYFGPVNTAHYISDGDSDKENENYSDTDDERYYADGYDSVG